MLCYIPRYPKKKTLLISCAAMILLCIFNILLQWWAGRVAYGTLILFTLVIPSFLFFFFLAKHRDARFIFTFCVVDTVSAEIIIISTPADTFLANDSRILMFIIRLLAFPIMEYLVIKKLRKPYAEIQNSLNKGWGVFALVSVLFYVLLLIMSIYPSLITERSHDVPAMLLMLVLMPLMYINIFQLLLHQNRIHAMEREQELLRLQVGFMEQRIVQTGETEERIRIERHDLRHWLQAVATMVEKGEHAEALDYINTSIGHLEGATARLWCSNPALDAAFSYYFRQAESKGIRIEASLAVPNELPMDVTELSIVLANALENAIHACEMLSPENRVLQCKCLNRPALMFQICTPFEGQVLLEENGRPVSSEKGHGIGTRSILAFCEKNGAFVDCKIENNWFYLRIALPA